MGTEKNPFSMDVKTIKVAKFIPPDGGWGWMVVLGAAVANIFDQSMLSVFSLLYGDALESMGHRTQGAAVVLSTMLFVTNFGGPIAGAIVKTTSPRFVAMAGACSCTMGIFLSGFSTNIIHLVLTYGVLLGLGLGFIQNSSFVAINSYFKLRKSRAVGLANVGTGVGQTLMPHLVSYLLGRYGFRDACILLGALSLHGIAGTMLIQPFHLHMKKVEEEVLIDENLKLLESQNGGNKILLSNGNSKTHRRATESEIYKKKSNARNGKLYKSDNELQANKNVAVKVEANGNHIEEPVKKTWLKKMYDLFDISLLSNLRFLNIIFGTALSVTSIQNFSMLFPFFLQKVANFDRDQAALGMSAVAIADICGRLILPTFQDKYKIKARWMLILTCTWLIVVRQILAYQTEFVTLIVMAGLYGFGRSMIIVARNIAISENCRPEQVPAAVGLGMLTMGVIVPPAGYFLGWIRDYTGSYITCITAQNLLLVLLLVMWIPDMLLLWMEERRKERYPEPVSL